MLLNLGEMEGDVQIIQKVAPKNVSTFSTTNNKKFIFGLFILFFTPVILYLDNKQNVYLFCFLAFWLLTINHAAMRLAAPAFIYALSLLKVKISELRITFFMLTIPFNIISI